MPTRTRKRSTRRNRKSYKRISRSRRTQTRRKSRKRTQTRRKSRKRMRGGGERGPIRPKRKRTLTKRMQESIAQKRNRCQPLDPHQGTISPVVERGYRGTGLFDPREDPVLSAVGTVTRPIPSDVARCCEALPVKQTLADVASCPTGGGLSRSELLPAELAWYKG